MKNEIFQDEIIELEDVTLLELEKKTFQRKSKEKPLTNDIVADFFKSLDYKPLSARKEMSCVKKAQLSFYDDVDDDRKQIFLENPNI